MEKRNARQTREIVVPGDILDRFVSEECIFI